MPRAKKAVAKTQRKVKPKSLKPKAIPIDLPGSRIGTQGLLILPQKQAGVHVTEYTSLTLGSFWGCVRCISEDLAKLPWGVFKKLKNGGKSAQNDHPNVWLLQEEANLETSAFNFRETILAHALVWGNGFAEIERDGAGRPHSLWQITPDRVICTRDWRGNIVYDIRNPREPNTVLPAEDVFHLKGMGFDGLVGYSVVHQATRAIGLGISLEECAANFSQNDSTPGGYLSHPGKLKEAAQANLRDSWNRVHAGPKKRRTIAVLEEGMQWKQTGLPPEDSQLIQQRQATPAEICRWFRVPPHKIADLMRATFSNIEEQNREYIDDALSPWARRLESEANIKLFGRINQGTLFTKIDFSQLERGNSVARSGLYNALLDRGVYSINDVLEREDMNPIGPDGDKRFVPLNMQLLDKAGEEPPPPKAPMPGAPGKPGADANKPGTGADKPPTGAPPKAPLSAILLPVLEDIFARVGRRQSAASARIDKLEGDEKKKAQDKFQQDQAQHIRAAVGPALSGFLESSEREIVIGIFLSEFASGMDLSSCATRLLGHAIMAHAAKEHHEAGAGQ